MSEIQAVGEDEHGAEVHPAFALIGAARVSVGGADGGAVLFDSDILHNHTVRIRISTARRKRALSHDWTGSAEQLIEVEMSEAQWASFVSSMNVGEGVPCTLRYRGHEAVPGLDLDPRLGLTMKETEAAADDAFDSIKDAMAVYEQALKDKAPAKERNEALNDLHWAIQNATPNVTYTGKQLVKQAEDVVNKARADVEAYVVAKAHQIGIDVYELMVQDGGEDAPALGF